MVRRTKAEAALTREKLLDAAENVFLARGVANATLEQIATEAGLTRGALYWHFKNKAEIFHAMLDRVRLPFQELIDELDEADRREHPARAIRLACQEGLKRLEQPRYHRVHSILIYHSGGLSELDSLAMQEEIANESCGMLTEYFQAVAQQGQLRADISPETAARLLQSTLGGVFHDWLRHPQEYSIHERGMEMVDTLLHLLCTTELP
ncbi:MAG: TetR family transcriptional regulator [Nitrincola lacisaponensis]|uniref:TetR family transcriptional regulator n=1 Tax=Nitrincola lacisaponensis TaxID=267850 RepID=UPI00391BC02A